MVLKVRDSVSGLVDGLGGPDLALEGSAMVSTGKFIDTVDEGALRADGAAAITYNTGTTQYSVEVGAGSITSGSTTLKAFTTTFETAPAVSLGFVWKGVTMPAVGSLVGGVGSVTKAGFNIVKAGSGCGYTYIAVGKKA